MILTPSTRLLLTLSDLWLRHMQAAAEHDPSEEIRAEIAELSYLRRATEEAAQAAMANAPDTLVNDITAYLAEHDPALDYCLVSLGDKPPTIEIRSVRPITRATADWLDQRAPGMVALNFSPRG